MKMISERRAAAYVAIAVLLSGVIFGLAIPAAIQAGQRNAMNMAWEPAEASWYEERTQRTVYALDPTPSYLELLDNELNPLSADPDPDSVWDVSAQGLHPFRGTFRGQGKVYTSYLFTGKDAYTVDFTCTNGSGTILMCTAYNASSGELLDGAITLQDESATMRLTGLSPQDKIYLTFTGDKPAEENTTAFGTIS